MAPASADENDYRRKLSEWESLRDAVIRAARDSAALRMRFQANKLGYFALGKPFKTETKKQKIKLLRPNGKRLGPKLKKADETVYIYEPAYSTLRPCRYNGEGKHRLERTGDGEAMLWMRLPDGKMGAVMIDGETKEIAVEPVDASREALLLLVKR